MKQKDILMLAVVAIISGAASFIISSKIFASPNNRQQQVEVVAPIQSAFSKPDATYFNKNSIDPTQLITIAPNSNSSPFTSSQQ